jgi:hypothetical protein
VSLALAIALLAASCSEAKGVASDVGVDLEGACPLVDLTCGRVFDCQMPDGTVLDVCWVDDEARELDAAIGGTCSLTQRDDAANGLPCVYQCPSARGCNAFDGCFCG